METARATPARAALTNDAAFSMPLSSSSASVLAPFSQSRVEISYSPA